MAPAHRRRKTKLGLSRTCFHLLPGLSASHGDHMEGGPWVCWVSAAWNKLCTHTQQCSDLCISIGVSGTACLWCGSRKENYLEPDQSRDKQSLPRSEYPESALRWLLYVWHSQVELGHGVGWSFPQTHKGPVAPHTSQPGIQYYSLCFLVSCCSQMCFSQGNWTFNADRARLHCQIWVAEMCDKVRSLDLGPESRRVGHELLWRIILWRWGGSTGIGSILEDKCSFPLICSLLHPVGFSQEDLPACTFVKLKPERENSPFSLC